MADKTTAKVELSALQDIARVLATSGDLAEVLQGVAEAIAGGRANRDVYIYVYDAETNELVLTGATESPAARQVGILRLACGDGVTGWVAASRESYLIAEEISRDPHFLAYPDIGEEQYGAIFSVPIVSRNDDLLGCVTVWATNGHRFDPAEVPFVERAAALVAGTFETARLTETDRHRVRLLDGLTELTAMVASRTPTPTTLEFATELARIAVDADIAVAVVTDPSGADRMHIKTGPSTKGRTPREVIHSARQDLLAVDQKIRNGVISWHAAGEEVTHALEGLAGAVATAPVRVGSDELGMMACYRIDSARFTIQDTGVVADVANHVAVALKLALLSDELTTRNSLNWFLRDLASGRVGIDELCRRAAAVGLDATSGHLFIVGSVASQPIRGIEVNTSSIGPSVRDLLARVPELPRETQFAVTPHQTVAVVPWAGDEESIDELRMPLLNVCAHLRRTAGTALTFGISRPVLSVDDFAGALAEAREAMAIGSTLENPNGVFTLDDVGHHLLLSRVSGVGSVRDRYATAIGRVAEYDRVKGTELLDTLAVFLHLRSQSAASRELFVHRNTLTQRLTRVSRLSGFDVFKSSEWFPLQLALKIHQARSGTGANDTRRARMSSPAHDAIDEEDRAQ